MKNQTNLKWNKRFYSLATGLVMVSQSAFAQATSSPADALNEEKVGIAAKFVPIKAGTFEMGSSEKEVGRRQDETLHTVTLTKDFEMQSTEVTQLQYFLVMGLNPSYSKISTLCDKDNYQAIFGTNLCKNHPVDGVNWEDTQAFILKLNEAQSEYAYRLPTEAEWEYAARAGTPNVFPYFFGHNETNELNNYSWNKRNSSRLRRYPNLTESYDPSTSQVGKKLANPLGLYDVYGNVFEWVQDFYAEYPQSSVTDPTGPASGSEGHVIRGGSFHGSYHGGQDSVELRSAFRTGFNIGQYNIGFRLVRTRK